MGRATNASPAAKRGRRRQTIVQLVATVFFNGYLVGFAEGKIYTGPSKAVCVPVLNCYSCPGALGACPIGALQNAVGGVGAGFPFYVLGSIMLFGIVLGRLICGVLCPFGFVQDLLHKIPSPKLRVPARIDRPLRWLKCVVLILLVVLMPAFIGPGSGANAPYFCEYLCPAGTLQAGIPLLATNPELRAVIGWLFDWKMLVLVATLALSVFVPRPFCRYLCPLGALYSAFNKFSAYQMRVDQHACIHCGTCKSVCPMNVYITETPASPECIRCGRCKPACPTCAISSGLLGGPDGRKGLGGRASLDDHDDPGSLGNGDNSGGCEHRRGHAPDSASSGNAD